jgi:hypothetical protein
MPEGRTQQAQASRFRLRRGGRWRTPESAALNDLPARLSVLDDLATLTILDGNHESNSLIT